MHACYKHIAIDDLVWEPVRPGEYERDCRAREIKVHVASDAVRDAIGSALVYKKGKLGHGRTVSRDVVVGGVRLLKDDVLTPSYELMNIHTLNTKPPPFTITFWRTIRDINGTRTGL
eukprot:5879602-Pyramimonas_sp.AAC.1